MFVVVDGMVGGQFVLSGFGGGNVMMVVGVAVVGFVTPPSLR